MIIDNCNWVWRGTSWWSSKGSAQVTIWKTCWNPPRSTPCFFLGGGGFSPGLSLKARTQGFFSCWLWGFPTSPQEAESTSNNPLKVLQKQSEPVLVNTHVFKFVFVLDVLSNELGVLYGLLHRYGLFEGGTDIATGADGCHTPRAEEVVIGARERQRQGRLAETRHHATAIIPTDENV